MAVLHAFAMPADFKFPQDREGTKVGRTIGGVMSIEGQPGLFLEMQFRVEEAFISICNLCIIALAESYGNVVNLLEFLVW